MTKHIFYFTMLFFIFSCSQDNGGKSFEKSQKSSDEVKQTKAVEIEEEEYKPKVLAPDEILSPTESIKALDKLVEGYHLGQNLSTEEIKENLYLKQRIIRGTFDIRELCRLSLAKHWDVLSQKKRDQFVNLMTKLLETKAIFSKEQLKGENRLYRLEYHNQIFDDPEKKQATVKTIMHVPKEALHLAITYKLLLTPYGWKIYDVIVDDASLLSNYKFQFDRIITKDGFEELIQRMESKLKSMG